MAIMNELAVSTRKLDKAAYSGVACVIVMWYTSSLERFKMA
jgi:hypothetical protein